MKKKVLVVGSGPAAYGSLMYLQKNKDLEITLIDNSYLNNVKKNKNSCVFESKFIDGTRVSENFKVFEENNFENKSNIKSSKAFGGFSNVWGGTFSSLDPASLKAFNDINIDIEKYLLIIKKFIPKKTYLSKNTEDLIIKPSQNTIRLYEKINSSLFPETNAEYSSIAITNEIKESAINKEKCDSCGQPKWTCDLNSIWSSVNPIKKLIENNQIKYLSNTRLVSFKEENSKVICDLEQKENQIKIEFDKVFLGAGVLNSSIIMINSGVTHKVKIKISEMINYPVLVMYKNVKKLDSFADLFINHRKGDNSYFLQFYFFSKTLSKFAEDNFSFSKILRFIPNWIMQYTGGIFVYFDSKISNNVEVFKNDENRIEVENILNQNSLELQKGLKEITTLLRKLKIFTLPNLKTNYFFGKSYHFGSQFPHAEKPSKNESDILGRLNGIKNVHIIDSSVLPVVNVGSITPTIIANSYRITMESIN